MGQAIKETFPKDPKAPSQVREGSYLGTSHQFVICTDRECSQGSGQFFMVRPFDYDDDAVQFARDHYETTGHQVLIPFKIYERKGK